MPLSPDIATQVVATCRENAGSIATALSHAFELPIEVDPKRIEAVDYNEGSPEWNGAGLIVALDVGGEAALALLAASCAFLPDALQATGPESEAKLQSLAADVAKLLLPAEQAVTGSRAQYVDHLAQALLRGGLAARAGAIRFSLRAGEKTAAMHLVWPATSPEAVLGVMDAFDAANDSDLAPQRKTPSAEEDISDRLKNLPSYARSLLRISVPVSVHLASIKQPVSRVLNIGPGTIIQFEKNCEQPLTLCVGAQPLAEGEAVKVGEKFGIKLTQMILPGERFFSLKGNR
jgi:flagellar motor switch/type III secretory pathway protein FliN